jgi:hypothetical protein
LHLRLKKANLYNRKWVQSSTAISAVICGLNKPDQSFNNEGRN